MAARLRWGFLAPFIGVCTWRTEGSAENGTNVHNLSPLARARPAPTAGATTIQQESLTSNLFADGHGGVTGWAVMMVRRELRGGARQHPQSTTLFRGSSVASLAEEFFHDPLCRSEARRERSASRSSRTQRGAAPAARAALCGAGGGRRAAADVVFCWWRLHDGDGADGWRRAMLMPAPDQHDTRRHSATSMSSEMMAADDAGGFLVPCIGVCTWRH